MDTKSLHSDRRLVAIMFTDIEGYTALMQQSESEAIRVRNLHKRIFQYATSQYSGEIIQYYGDGTLSIFNSAVQAVRCALLLQEQLTAARIPTRIGIHMADIIITKDDIIGDGVNVASRIESLAVAGSVLVSGRLVEELKNQDDIRVMTMGSYRFKNIAKPIEVFALDDPRILVPQKSALSGKLDSFKGRNRKSFAILGSLLLVAVLTISWLLFSASKIKFPERGWLVVSDIENHTGDTVLSGSLDQVMVAAIQQSGYINIFPRSEVQQTLQRMGLRDQDTLKTPVAIEVALRENLDAVLSCRIEQVGKTYILTAEIIDPVKNTVLGVISTRVDNRDKILDGLDKMTKKLRRKLGESLAAVDKDPVPLSKATTGSLSALKDFSLGNQYWYDNQYSKAVELYHSAVKLDSTFAWAHLTLGSYYYLNGDRPTGEKHFEMALRQLDRLTEREQLWITTSILGSRGDRERHNNTLEIYLGKYPDDFIGWYNLGTSYMQIKQYDKGLYALGRAISIFKNHKNAFINMATIYSLKGEFDSAIEHYHQAFKIDSTLIKVPNINREYGLAYVALDSLTKAKMIFSDLLGGDLDQKASAHRSMGLLDMYQGDYDSAIYHLKQTVMIHERENYWVSVARDRLYLAQAYLDIGLEESYQAELRAIQSIYQEHYLEPNWLTNIGKAYLRRGEIQKAQNLLKLIEERKNENNAWDESAWNLLQGEIAMAQGNNQSALPHLEAAYSLVENNYNLESLAFCHFKSGHLQSARDLYLKIISQPSFGWEGQKCWIEAHYQLGLIYQSLGNHQEAKSYYGKLLKIWKRGTDDLVLLRQAKSKIMKLP